MNKKILAFIIVVGLIIIALFTMNSVLKDGGEDIDILPEEVVVTASVSAPEQASGMEVFISEVVLPDGGYVVIHRATEEGTPGDIIGNSEFITGKENNILITLTEESVEGDILFAMLHIDDGDGVFNFPGPDVPLTVDGSIVMVSFEIISEGKLENEIKL